VSFRAQAPSGAAVQESRSSRKTAPRPGRCEEDQTPISRIPQKNADSPATGTVGTLAKRPEGLWEPPTGTPPALHAVPRKLLSWRAVRALGCPRSFCEIREISAIGVMFFEDVPVEGPRRSR
jgi:hypothetical protein